MLVQMKSVLMVAAAVAAVGLPCGLCVSTDAPQRANVIAAGQAADTAVVRFHVSGMTCGSCPATARLAFQRVAGVYGAKVTLDDSLGVVRYDPQRVTPAYIAAELKRLTGFAATVLSDSRSDAPRRVGSKGA